jgi:eukaryotic-like serine/threonine-protein kinase
MKELFAVAQETQPSQRSAFLDQACGDDRSLRSELDDLLAADEEAGTRFLNDPQITSELGGPASTSASTRIGRRIGSYQLVEEIGVGGMGEVYRAVRADDQYHKQVAIKLVRAGEDSRFVIDRFKNERQVLASLDHPNIARLLDGGTTEEGVPYFVMELIEGAPINEYGDSHKLATTARLILFLQVCSAVQHAHQRLIIHRDLKPSNILITSDEIPKLLDFGIAKIVDPAADSDLSEPTISMFRLLTPAYASPEQIKGEAITTASDVYSLGVVLYELLTGHRPYRIGGRALHEIAQAVCEFEPERLSTVLGRNETRETTGSLAEITAESVSTVRDGSTEKLRKRLRGDLDNIVLMALRKEPQLRYASVEQFATDIRRHLENLPVSASNGTLQYRASKFIRRHKAGVAAAILVAAAVLAGVATTLHEAHVARRHQLRAEQRFNDVRKLTNTLLFDVHDSIQSLPGATAARNLIVSNALQYLDRLSADAGDDQALQRELAAGYLRLGTVQGNANTGNLGQVQNARASYEKAVAILLRLVSRPPDDPEVESELATAYSRLADMKSNQDPEALLLYEKSLLIRKKLQAQNPGDRRWDQALTLSWAEIATVFLITDKYPQAEDAANQSLAAAQRYLQGNPSGSGERSQVSLAYTKLGIAQDSNGKIAEAINSLLRALQIDLQLAQEQPNNADVHRDLAIDYERLGECYLNAHRAKTAISEFQRAIPILEKISRADPSDNRTQYLLALNHELAGSASLQNGTIGVALAEFNAVFRICHCRPINEKDNERPLRLAANTYKGIADTYQRAARGTSHKGMANSLLACANYRNSLAAFGQLQDSGYFGPLDRATRDEVAQSLKACQ